MNSHESITAPLSSGRRAWNGAMRFLLYAAAALICALLVFLIGYILYRGIPNLSWQFLSSEESVINDIQGILPAIVNTFYVIFWTLIIILPLGVGSAYTSRSMRRTRSSSASLSSPPRPSPACRASSSPSWA